jgi:ABC-type uncharacterized transport system permease subunit
MRAGYIKVILVSSISVSAAILISGIFMLFTGNNPVAVYGMMISMTFGSMHGFGQLIFYATPMIFTGLAVAFAFRGGLFNIGCEGQVYIGGFLCAWTGWALKGLPSLVLIPLCVIAAALGGALWAAVPGLLKAKRGAHEVITTIMMNFIAFALVNYLVTYHFSVPETVRTPAIGANAVIGRLGVIAAGFKNSPANFSFLLSLAAAAAVYYIIYRSRAGYETSIMGANRDAARYSGINLPYRIFYIMCVSGALAGLSSINFVLGYKHYFEQGFSGGIGFVGIAVALLGRNNPAGVILASFFFAYLVYGGLAVNSCVPKELLEMLQGIIILSAAASAVIVQRLYMKYETTD